MTIGPVDGSGQIDVVSEKICLERNFRRVPPKKDRASPPLFFSKKRRIFLSRTSALPSFSLPHFLPSPCAQMVQVLAFSLVKRLRIRPPWIFFFCMRTRSTRLSMDADRAVFFFDILGNHSPSLPSLKDTDFRSPCPPFLVGQSPYPSSPQSFWDPPASFFIIYFFPTALRILGATQSGESRLTFCPPVPIS